MDSQQVERNLLVNAKKLEADFVEDMRGELKHIADPSQCGVIVEKHFDGFVIAIYIFITLFVLAAMGGIILYLHH